MGKKDYRTTVLDYLKKYPGTDIAREILIEKTGISKSRLSEVLNSIKADGYTIITPPRSGKVRLELSSDENLLPTIKNSDIRQWIILLLLSKFEKLTFNELLVKTLSLKDSNLDQMKILIDIDSDKKSYDNNNLIKIIRKNAGSSFVYSDKDVDVAKDIISVTALRSDLSDLRKQGLVRMRKERRTYYELTTAAPYIIPISEDSLFEFCQRYEESASATTSMEPLKQAYTKISRLIDMDENDINQRRFGKSNQISQKQIDTFNAFIEHPYKTNVIQLDSTFKGEKKSDHFAVGLLFYSVETSCFYAFGKNLSSGRLETRRLDWIEKITTLDEPHQEFHHAKYFKYYSEMFSSSYEGTAYNVRVLFTDFGNVCKRFFDLKNIRENATIRPVENPPEGCIYNYIYEDTVRGLYDFARYLRGFGMAALAMDPPELTEKMLFTYNRIIEKYEGGSHE